MSADRFKQSVINTLSRRAANRCSNPDCGAITSGPADEPTHSVNVGEAAHIYGAHEGSARYDVAMESADRAAISNAIWLCASCHKIVDDDPGHYPADLLFEWQREHEQHIARSVGKAGADIRRRYEERHLEEFGKLSRLAERLILEKDDFWEHRLTAEVLRFETAPILRRWQALKSGLYINPYTRVLAPDRMGWFQTKNHEIQAAASAFSQLTNAEFKRAWGDPGVAGSDIAIVETCRLYAEVCSTVLRIEEEVRFTNLGDALDDVRKLYIGVAGLLIDEAGKIPTFINEVFNGELKSGVFTLTLSLDLPAGWNDAITVALEQALPNYIEEVQQHRRF